jgi:hypothetical protein
VRLVLDNEYKHPSLNVIVSVCHSLEKADLRSTQGIPRYRSPPSENDTYDELQVNRRARLDAKQLVGAACNAPNYRAVGAHDLNVL